MVVASWPGCKEAWIQGKTAASALRSGLRDLPLIAAKHAALRS
jgi:hypothetical protein